jgi:hypothetical protein
LSFDRLPLLWRVTLGCDVDELEQEDDDEHEDDDNDELEDVDGSDGEVCLSVDESSRTVVPRR